MYTIKEEKEIIYVNDAEVTGELLSELFLKEERPEFETSDPENKIENDFLEVLNNISYLIYNNE